MTGSRAQYACVVALAATATTDRQERLWVERAAELFGLPLVAFDQLEAEGRRHAVPLLAPLPGPEPRPRGSRAPSTRFMLPADLHYWVERHVWARKLDGLVTVGVTSPLSDALHWSPDLRFWAGSEVKRGSVIATADGRDARTVRIASPVAGVVAQANPLLEVAPHALVTQPYKGGWVVRIGPTSWDADAARLEFGAPAVTRYRRMLDEGIAQGVREDVFGGALLAVRSRPAATTS